MHYQLFFPGKTSNAASCLRSVGLADFVDGANEMPLTGRDSAPVGLLVTWGDLPKWDPPNQAVTDCTGYKLVMWLGEERRCTPADLARQSLFTGYKITLSDKQEWQVSSASDLPSGFRLVDGQWTKVRKPQFVDFWNRSEAWYRRYMIFALNLAKMAADANKTQTAFLHEWVEYCVFSLRQNYRLNSEIASELGILGTDDLNIVTSATVDGMAIEEVTEELQRIQDVEATQKKDGDSVTTES